MKPTNQQLLLFVAAFMLAVTPVVANGLNAGPYNSDHTSSALVEPEWSALNTATQYELTMTNDGPSPIRQVRIYENDDFSNWEVANTTGWEKQYVTADDYWLFTVEAPDQNNWIQAGENETFNFNATTPVALDDECVFPFTVMTVDTNATVEYPEPGQDGGFYITSDNTKFDDKAPTSDFEYDQNDFYHEEDGTVWVDTQTILDIDATDNGLTETCTIGLNTTYYRVARAADVECQEESGITWDESEKDVEEIYTGSDGAFVEYPGDFPTLQESCHVVEYYSTDNFGNTESQQTEYFYVDKSLPEVSLENVGEERYAFWNEGSYQDITVNSTSFSAALFETDLTVAVEGGLVKWQAQLEDVTQRTATGFSVIIADDTEPLFTYGYNPSEGEVYKEWDGSTWVTQSVPPGFQQIGTSGDINFEVHIPTTEFNDNFYWAVNSEMTAPGAPGFPGSSSEQSNFPSDWGRWSDAASNTAFFMINDWHVTTDTDITLACEDVMPHPSGADRIIWQWERFATEDSEGETSQLFSASNDEVTFNFDQTSRHELTYTCVDNVGKQSEEGTAIFKVDNEAPVYDTTVEGSYHIDGQQTFLDGESGVAVFENLTDPTPVHASGVDRCDYEVYWNNSVISLGTWNGDERLELTFNEDSRHDVNITCYDNLGNSQERMHTYFVDMEAPETTSTYGAPEVNQMNGTGTYKFITNETPVNLTAVDEKVGVENLTYRYGKAGKVPRPACYFENNADSNITGTEFSGTVPGDAYSFTFEEAGCNVLEYYATDKFGNQEMVNREHVIVDIAAPNTNTTENGTVTEDNETTNVSDGDGGTQEVVTQFKWVTQETDVNLVCQDNSDNFQVGNETFRFKVVLNDTTENGADPSEVNFTDLTEQYCPTTVNSEGNCVVNGTSYNFTFMEDSNHYVDWFCQDALNNTGNLNKFHYKVDSTAPTTNINYTGEYYVDANETDYIDTNSSVELSTEDGGPVCAIGNETTYYRWYMVEDAYCEGTTTAQPTSVNWQFDNTSENSGTFPSNGRFVEGPGEPVNGYGSARLEIQGEGAPSGDNGAGVALLGFDRIGYPVANITDLGYWVYVPAGETAAASFQLEVDYYCDYTSGNYDGRLVHSPSNLTSGEWNYVNLTDQKQFRTTNSDITNESGTGVEALDNYYTLSEVQSEFPDACLNPAFGRFGVKLGTSTTDAVSFVDAVQFNEQLFDFESQGVFKPYEDSFDIPEESCHVVEAYSVDALGNEEDVQRDYIFVDKQTPDTNVTVASGNYANRSPTSYATPETEFGLEAEDANPHPSGVASTEYRWKRVNDSYCELTDFVGDQISWEVEGEPGESLGEQEWNTYEGPFDIPEESCHVIQYRSIDNVGKMEEAESFRVYIDNSTPITVKTVGEPNEPANGSDFQYYDGDAEGDINAANFCPEGVDNCFKVTMLTPINMSCSAEGPHPVGGYNVTFHVGLDSNEVDDNATARYCEEYGGTLTTLEGLTACTVPQENVEEFYFLETSEHQLTYSCTDDFERVSEPDTELFKVSETAFNLSITKKDALVSVPVQLLDDSMDAIFEGFEEEVNAVWQFNGTDWQIYTPGEAPDNLDTMLPGYGYWVEASSNVQIPIGGDLVKPRQAPPSRYLPTNGDGSWHLLGVYGSYGREGYFGPSDGIDESTSQIVNYASYPTFGPEQSCAFGSIQDNLNEGQVLGYYDAQDGNSPGTYGVLGDQRLDPGAGYWAYLQGDDTYTVSICPGGSTQT